MSVAIIPNLFPGVSQTTPLITYFKVTEIFIQKFFFVERKHEEDL
jgi:hypothetical protein